MRSMPYIGCAFTDMLMRLNMNKRLSSKDFLEKFDTMWKEGPKVKYQNPDSWVRFT
jgi:hypothetical protein